MKYFYFHGYKSGPGAEKANILRDILGSENVTVPDFNVEPSSINDLFNEIEISIKNEGSDNVCIVGSSLGGLYGLYISARTKCHAVLLNPALFPMLIVPKITSDIEPEILVKVQMLSLYAFENYKVENVRVWLTNDELINHKDLTEPFFYRGAKELRYFNEDEASCHAFNGFRSVFEKYINKK